MNDDVFNVTAANQLPQPTQPPPSYALGSGGVLPPEAIASYREDGVVCLRQVIAQTGVERLREAVDRSAEAPGPLGYKIGEPGKPGFFYYDFQIHERQDGYRWFVRESGVPALAGALMGSPGVTLHYSNLFVKDGGSKMPSPWHEDASYSRIDGEQCLNFWVSLDTIPEATALIFLRGSHRRDGPIIAPRHFDPDADYDLALSWNRAPVSDPESLFSSFEPIWWELEPGDAVVFNQRILHGAPANTLATRRRAAALLMMGDEATYNADPGTSDPPFRDDSKAHGEHPAGAVFPRLI
ncbi:MAG: hypothetical protein HOI34_16290 [Rhodospirillaceae bacterium]|jgi:hypothetical protein|nr:hypothetical protein [Rhodospirillaceae bacterium]MBT6509696.1 hypothetical protein [Rhodospirillaceae bacterium]MBT7613276.1 hypothetical protein [Rhodospirillaceae bacterium]MBT7646325.1 hypothetical protein [Rhodospirillaceae bacterium]